MLKVFEAFTGYGSQRIALRNLGIEQLLNVIKDNQINSLEQQIEALEKRIEDGKTTQDMLHQVEKDFKHVREETESVLEGIGNE